MMIAVVDDFGRPGTIEGPDCEEAKDIHLGDKFTIRGMYHCSPNPAWRWWAFWRPRTLRGPLAKFEVVAICHGQP